MWRWPLFMFIIDHLYMVPPYAADQKRFQPEFVKYMTSNDFPGDYYQNDGDMLHWKQKTPMSAEVRRVQPRILFRPFNVSEDDRKKLNDFFSLMLRYMARKRTAALGGEKLGYEQNIGGLRDDSANVPPTATEYNQESPDGAELPYSKMLASTSVARKNIPFQVARTDKKFWTRPDPSVSGLPRQYRSQNTIRSLVRLAMRIIANQRPELQ